MSRLPIRARLALLCAGAVAVAIVTASVLAWLSTRHTLREQVDASLDQRVDRVEVVADGSVRVRLPEPEMLCRMPVPMLADDSVPRLQLVRADGTFCAQGRDREAVPPSEAEYDVARGERPAVLRDATTAGGERVRLLTTPVGDGYALQVSRPLTEVDAALRELGIVLGLAAALGVALAAGAGVVVARMALRPVDRLTGAAEHVARTEDLDVPIEVTGRDEVARLTTAFNAMTGRLAASRRRQQQLIADSSHELRTPLTSLRTNVEWLMRSDDRGRPLDARHRRQVEQAVVGQIDELSTLIGELGALARDEPAWQHVPVDLGQVVLRAVDRAQRRDPNRRFQLDVEPWPMRGDPVALERAVLNLLDNALKFSDGPVVVRVASGRVSVSDRGPGLDAAGHAQAFDRFWRAPTARELPGSGLGLAIVADTAERHGGTVFFRDADGGGSEVGFRLPAPPPGSVPAG